ncbi:hypothetical protein CANCADRAFT_57949 [Tortispora caseinolytica NRRL Y-17796]|uniref:TATA element modulatory factor 1 TATA binding domain-containing protein n=1 Tax=Tortispora caseinolytica NRRL Y-17796 TaxID=767744 RepID=A0A1E4TAT4_9ASCO|nr:hypothetical protein CANCADRAFT_57949 [Tortispora caseinolytica NRRL Y-17796]
MSANEDTDTADSVVGTEDNVVSDTSNDISESTQQPEPPVAQPETKEPHVETSEHESTIVRSRPDPHNAPSSDPKSLQWNGFLKIVANVEQKLDRVLQAEETSTRKTMPSPRRSEQRGPRLSMQERLGKVMRTATTSSNTPPRTNIPVGATSARKSIDSTSDANADQNPSDSQSREDPSFNVLKDPKTSQIPDTTEDGEPESNIEAVREPNEKPDQQPRLHESEESTQDTTQVSIAKPAVAQVAESSSEKEEQQPVSVQRETAAIDNEQPDTRLEPSPTPTPTPPIVTKGEGDDDAESLRQKVLYLSNMLTTEVKKLKSEASTMAERKLLEKDERIALLMSEGIELSKKELKLMNTIKSMKSREQENRLLVSTLRSRLEKAENAASEATEKLSKLASSEKTLDEANAIRRENMILKNQNASLSEELKLVKADNEMSVRTVNSHSMTIDAQRTEISTLSARCKDLEKSLVNETDAMKKRSKELENEIKSKTLEANQKIAEMTKEYSELEQKYEDIRSKYEEYALTFGDNTSAPVDAGNLKKQLESLKAQYESSIDSSNAVEASLSMQISELESSLHQSRAQAEELRSRNKSLATSSRESQERIRELETKVSELTGSHSTSEQEVIALKENIKVLQEEQSKMRKAHEKDIERLNELYQNKIDSLNETIKQLEKEKRGLEDTLESLQRSPRMSVSSPRELKRTVSSSNWGPLAEETYFSSNTRLTPGSRTPGEISNPNKDQDMIMSPTIENESFIGGRDDFKEYDSPIGSTGNASHLQLIERMASRVRSVETQLLSYKDRLSRYSKERDSLRSERLELSRKIRTIEEKYEALQEERNDMAKHVAEAKQREQDALVLLGEKAERVQELEQDMEDLKALYKETVTQLLGSS